jgi:hypothetical protein
MRFVARWGIGGRNVANSLLDACREALTDQALRPLVADIGQGIVGYQMDEDAAAVRDYVLAVLAPILTAHEQELTKAVAQFRMATEVAFQCKACQAMATAQEQLEARAEAAEAALRETERKA